MKTSELIKLLQMIDPDGEAIVTTPNGTPYFIDKVNANKEAPYSYFDVEDNLIISNKGIIIDIVSLDVWGFVQKNYTPTTGWEEIKKKIKFDLEYPTTDETNIRMATTLKIAKESFDMIKKIHEDANSLDDSNIPTNIPSISSKKKKIGLLSKKILNK